MGYKRSVAVHKWNRTLSVEKLLRWAVQQSPTVLFLAGDAHPNTRPAFDYALALAPQSQLRCTSSTGAFDKLEAYQQRTEDWLFGHLAYDLKNDLEALHSKQRDRIGFPELFFFQPQKLLFKKGDQLEFHYLDKSRITPDYHAIRQIPPQGVAREHPWPELALTLDESQYLERVQRLQAKIQRGDFYEINYCLELAGRGQLDPLQTYLALQALSKAPFSSFYALEHLYALCASPERYLCKRGSELLSQPIKGSAPRALDAAEDAAHRAALQHSPKERAENAMVVDLVRNDLSRVAQPGSVKVTALQEIHSFRQLHHMVSTIRCQLADTHRWVEALKATFPMGSMTGAPKPSVLKTVESTENFKRGLYSGAIGYLSPELDFDFNVVIRTLLYNAENHQLSHPVGSAITALSDPAREYEECKAKCAALRALLARRPRANPTGDQPVKAAEKPRTSLQKA